MIGWQQTLGGESTVTVEDRSERRNMMIKVHIDRLGAVTEIH